MVEWGILWEKLRAKAEKHLLQNGEARKTRRQSDETHKDEARSVGHFKISDVARIVGVSPETLRLYEKKGILEPVKNPKSGYRYYRPLDVGTLIRCRSYGQYGINIADSAQLINDDSVLEVHGRLQAQEAVMAYEIEKQQRALRLMKDLNQVMLRCEEEAGRCSLAQAPPMLRLDYQHNGDLFLEKPGILEQFETWSAALPITFLSMRVPLDTFVKGENSYYTGLGVFGEDADFLEISPGGVVAETPGGLAVRSILCVEGCELIDIHAFFYMYEYALKEGYSPCGDAYSRMVVVTGRRKIETCKRYYEFWLPVEKANL